MSLLLFFPGPGSTSTGGNVCWTDTTLPADTWSTVTTEYFDTWDDWSTTTWGALLDSGRTWAFMSGDTFIDSTAPSTTWTSTTLPSEDCTS